MLREGLFLLSHFKGNHQANLFTCWLMYKVNQTVAFSQGRDISEICFGDI